MPKTLKINCLVLGDPRDRIFAAKLRAATDIMALRDEIKRQRVDLFKDVPVATIGLKTAFKKYDEIKDLTELPQPNLDPLQRVDQVFVKLDSQDVHVIIIPPAAPPTSLSERDVLNLIPPNITYSLPPGKILSTATSHSPFHCTPVDVVDWTDFSPLVNSYIPSVTPQFSQEDFNFESLAASNEAGVQFALQTNVCLKLEKLVEGNFTASAAVTMIGIPDLIFHIQQTLLLAIEVKTSGVLPRVHNLAEKFNQDIQVANQNLVPAQSTIKPIGQIFGYLDKNKLQYGILTTYQQTWFLRRHRGKLYVSPTIDYDNQSPTLFQCYLWIIKQAIQDPFNEPAPLPLPSEPQQQPPPPSSSDSSDNPDDDIHDDDYDPNNSQDARKGNKSTRAQQQGVALRKLSTGFSISIGNVSTLEFSFRGLLGEGRSGSVFQAHWRGQTVAVKICDLYQKPQYEEEVLTEVAVYDTLTTLQGHCIPQLKIAGYDGGFFVIATEIGGVPLELQMLSHEERLGIVKQLSCIHSYGILHNDIRLANILMRHSDGGFKTYFIDFALSKRASRSETRREMRELKRLLNV